MILANERYMIKKSTLIHLAILLCSLSLCRGQGLSPEPGVVYSDASIPRIDLYLPEDSLDALYDDPTSDEYFRAQFVFTRDGVRDSVPNVGLRLRGNFSRFANKKNFKVSFNRFLPGGKWHALEKLNVNGQANDPSVIRAKLVSDLIPAMNVEGTRAAHTDVYINGRFYGLYINVEHIDEQFVRNHFGTDLGNLYKCLYPTDLVWQGSSPSSYDYCEWKRGGDISPYSDLIHFIDVLNNTPDGDLECELEAVLNVDDYLRQAAIDVMTGNWDGYIYNINNLYLFQNPISARMEYIIYDTDHTYGLDWIGRDWGVRDIYSWDKSSEYRPLYERLMDNPVYRARFSWYIDRLSSDLMNPAGYFARIDALKAMITPSAEADEYRPLDHGYSISNFHSSYTSALGGHVDYGLKPFVTTRVGTAVGQLESYDMAPVLNHLSHNFPVLKQPIHVKAFAEDDQTGLEVWLVYALDGELDSVLMVDDGMSDDGLAGDGIYGVWLDALMDPTDWSFQIRARGADDNSTLRPCDPVQWRIDEPAIPLYINEFMAANSSYMADEQGDFEDWVEIYNGGETSIFLGDKYLSNEPGRPSKWRMPSMNLAPGAFAWFWADNDAAAGPNHTNFRLSASGGSIGIYASQADRLRPIHVLNYGEQSTNVSVGLLPDGAGELQVLSTPTPGWSNVLTGIEPGELALSALFPNPASDRVFLRSSVCQDWDLRGMDGRTWRSFSQASDTWLNISGIPPGIYLLSARCEQMSSALRLVVQ